MTPLAGDILNPQSLNRYAYVLNNPTNLIDPLGLHCRPGAWGYEDDCPTVEDEGSGSGSVGVGQIDDAQQEMILATSTLDAGSSGDSTKEMQQEVQKVVDALPQALIKDPECLQFLGMKGAKPLALIRSTPVSLRFYFNQNQGGGNLTRWNERSMIPVGNSIRINTNGYALLYLGPFTFGGQSVNTGSPRALAEVLVHEFAHGANVIQHEGGSDDLQEQNASALAKGCSKTINSFINTPFVW